LMFYYNLSCEPVGEQLSFECSTVVLQKGGFKCW